MEFAVRALRGRAVPLVIPIARTYQALDENGRPPALRSADQLLDLGREVVRGARQFATEGTWDYALAGRD